MPLQSGTKLGAFEILASIGAGGMGEVYRARDTKLGRDVAIKVLPEAFSQDRARLARFEREARLLASLNHPNIAAIYGVEKPSGIEFLVLEFVPGETLGDRIRQGAIPADETLPLFQQIADGLEAAHEKGIIHRDLKPANIKLTPQGKVKILDFGLGKAFADEAATSDLSQSPTLTREDTQAGIILGTAPYMSPEQARGKAVDTRADIWAFGCCLYEALTGKMAFQGTTVADVLAAVIKVEPNWNHLPAETPSALRRLMTRCLRKQAKERLHHIADARLDLVEAAQGAADSGRQLTQPASRLVRRELWAWVAAAALGLTALSSLGVQLFWRPMDKPAVHITVPPPGRYFHPPPTSPEPALSPDGKHLAFTALTDNVRRLWLRPLDSATARPLPATEGALLPFWSPDSRFIGFSTTDGALKKIHVAGGRPQTIATAGAASGSWHRGGTVLFGSADALYTVPEQGGEPVRKALDVDGTGWFLWPNFLPDSDQFFFMHLTDVPSIRIGSLDTEQTTLLMKDASNVIYAPEGYVLFVREGALFAQRFDLRSLSLQGEPLLLEEQVVFNPQWRFSGLSVSNNGILSYATRRPSWNELVWFDRHGRRLGSLGAPSHRFNPHLSPDDERIAVEQLDPETGNWDIWTVDAQSGDPARVTFAPSLERHPVWSPDGTRLALISTQGGYARVYQKFLRGSGELDLLLGSNLIHNGLTSWSKDGALLMQILTLETDEDCWVLTLNETPTSEPFLQGPSAEIHSQISSDGRWVAYSSNETGKFEVYVSSYPSNDAPMRVSTAGGYQPRWRGDDQELYYLSPEGKLMAAKAKSGRRLVFSEPSALFPITTEPEIRERWTYDVASDGQRFLFVVRLDGGSSSISVVVNWTEKLKR